MTSQYGKAKRLKHRKSGLCRSAGPIPGRPRAQPDSSPPPTLVKKSTCLLPNRGRLKGSGFKKGGCGRTLIPLNSWRGYTDPLDS